MQALIFSDDDLDGLTSARLAQMAAEASGGGAEVVFQDWAQFGVTAEDIILLKQKLEGRKFDTLFVLDIGSSADIVERLAKLQKDLGAAGIAVNIYLFDNHPQEDFPDLKKRHSSKSFFMDSSTDNCTAGLVFKRFEKGYGTMSKWARVWAVLGIKGDVAYDEGEGKEIYDRVLAEMPELLGQRVTTIFKDNEYKREYSPVMDVLPKYFHIPRRVAFGEGTAVSFAAMKEIEALDDIFALETLPDTNENATEYPSLTKVRRWYADYPKWHSVFKSGNMVTLEFPRFVMMVINYQWNVGSAACFPPDTYLLYENKFISDFKPGDGAFGLSGMSHVVETYERDFHGQMISIKADGLLPITATPDHPFLASLNTHRTNVVNGFRVAEWVTAANLIQKLPKKDGHYLVMPVMKGHMAVKSLNMSQYNMRKDKGLSIRVFPLNRDTAWFIGLYVAEGSSGRGVHFSLHRKETRLAERLLDVSHSLGFSGTVVEHKRSQAIDVKVPSMVMMRALRDWCGSGASQKQIPNFILSNKDNTILSSFLSGYVAGDGSTENDGGAATVSTTVSRKLALQLQLAWARFKKAATVKVKKGGDGQVLGRHVKLNDSYYVRVKSHIDKKSHIKLNGNSLMFPIRRISLTPYSGKVYNMETTDGTYLVNGIAVHNCNIKSNEYKKTTLCLNYGIPGAIHLGARNPSPKEGEKLPEDPLPIGRLLSRASELSGGLMTGGGLEMAGSAMLKTKSLSSVLEWLLKAADEVGGKS